MSTKILEKRRLADGTLIRLQQRGLAFDVLHNDTGYCWRYDRKAVPEMTARNRFFLLALQAAP